MITRMGWVQARSALFGIQWYATSDGWLDRTKGPALASQLSQARDLGYAAVRIDVPEDLTVGQYVDLLAEYGLAPAPAYLGVQLEDDGRATPESSERARQTAALHAEAGLSSMFLGCGMSKAADRVARHPARGLGFNEARLDRVRDSLAAVAEVICAEGVRPGLHPHVGTWVETELETRYVLDTVDPALLAFGPDTGHLAWAGIDPARIMADYRQRIDHVHIKDVSASVSASSLTGGLNYQQTVLAGIWREPGLGDVDLDAVLGVLGPTFDGWLIVEVDRPFLPTPGESISACARWFRQRS